MAATDSDEVNYGFQRKEMYTEIFAGVEPYERHVVLVYKSHQNWPCRFAISDSDPLPKHLTDAFRARVDEMSVKSLLTICEGGDVTGLTDGDVLIFPDMIKYRGLEESNIDSFMEEVIVNGKQWEFATPEVVTGSYVFVCAHKSRDNRCGVCGPALIEKFNAAIEVKGLKDQVFVSPCSHVGGCRYGGNLIIYSATEDGKVFGHWYGYVTPKDVPELLEQHIQKGEIVKRIWRCQMGVRFVKKTKKVGESLPNENHTKTSLSDYINSIIHEKETKMAGKKVTDKLEFFTRKQEQHEFFTGAAVVAAVATVAVAYSLYKRSG